MELDLGQPFSFGHSCGGAAALLAEESNPGLFRSIYCYEPVMWPDVQPLEPTFDNNPLSKHALARRETFPSRQAALDNFSSKPPMNSFDPEALAAYIDFGFGPVSELRGQVGTGSREAPADSAASDVKVSNVKTASIAEIANSGAVGLRCRRQDEAEIYAFGFSHDAYMNLGKIRCPVTFAGGAKADVFDAKYLEMLATRASQASVEVLDSLDHFGPMQDPDAVAASINNAFGRYL
jgi:pimeloyl-ACP methyl ester carboxylesterase